jgi:hypothetical protein
VLEIDSWDIPSSGDFAYFDNYAAIAGETIRVVVNFTDDGSSYLPAIYINGDQQSPRTWGLNYYTYRAASDGDVTIEMGGTEGYTVNLPVP